MTGGTMALTLNYNKIGVILDAILIIGFIVIFLIIFPPYVKVSRSNEDDGLRTYELLERELESVRESQRESLEQIHDLTGKLETVQELTTDIGSRLDQEFGNSLYSGDLIIESGVLIDESKLITSEIQRRLFETN